MAWVTKDSVEQYDHTPEPPKEYTKKEKASNWWHYNKWIVLGSVIAVVAVLTCVVPAILFIVMKHFGIISDVQLNRQRERFLPYTIITVCYVVGALYLFNINAPTWMWMFLFGAATSALVSMVVNFFWKISAHMAGIGGLIGLLCKINNYGDGVFDLMPIICVMIITAGILGTSRIAMERHTLWQVIAGVLNGFLCVYMI